MAKSHIACVVRSETAKAITAYELFSFAEDETLDFPNLFDNVAAQSPILSQRFNSTNVYINNEFCVPVPIFKFNKEIAAEYLSLVFGEDASANIQFEHLPIEPGIMNVFRVKNDWYKHLNQHLHKPTYRHTYSNIISRAAYKRPVDPPEVISIQFYNSFIIVTVLKDGAFHLIQTFTYETPEDVLYYLLNITRQLELFSKTLRLQISGMIDLDFQLYRELIKYFKHVTVETLPASALIKNISEHPVHYFTPFFNLAL